MWNFHALGILYVKDIMREDLLHFIWEFRKFNFLNLFTACGKSVEILNPGKINKLDGPDFFMAKIKIDDTIWVGNVEIHINASDWYKHQHQLDKKYENIILHVVYKNDLKSDFPFPVLELQGKIPPILFQRFLKIMESKSNILCQNYLPEIPNIIKTNWQERLLIERLERKNKEIEALFFETKNDWENTFFRYLGRYLGGSKNKNTFDLLFKSFELNILSKHADNIFQIEAILLGQAGFLEGNHKEEYPNKIKEEYLFLKHKYKLTPIPLFLWDFKSIRPPSYPNIRLVQLAQIIHYNFPFFDKIIQNNGAEINLLFENIAASNFWTNHYLFKPSTQPIIKKTGLSFANMIYINVIFPFLYTYGKLSQKPWMQENALQYIRKLKPEKNHITALFKPNEFENHNAANSQSLIQLFENYCSKKKCLNCSIGNKILREEKTKFVVEEEWLSWAI